MIIHPSSMGRILLFEISINLDRNQFCLSECVMTFASHVVITALLRYHINKNINQNLFSYFDMI